MKANVAEIAVTYMAAYPNARILYASEKDFSTANRIKFFNTIKNTGLKSIKITRIYCIPVIYQRAPTHFLGILLSKHRSKL